MQYQQAPIQSPYPQAQARPQVTYAAAPQQAGQPAYAQRPVTYAGQPAQAQPATSFRAGAPMTYAAAPQVTYASAPQVQSVGPAVRPGQPAGQQSYGAPASSVRMQQPVVQAQQPVAVAPLAAPAVQQQDDPQLRNLKELRKTSGLKNIPVEVGLKTLKACAIDGRLTREQFLAGYQQMLASNGVDSPTDAVKNAVFDLFDRDGNHIVDMMELICGISLLCSGNEDEKIHAVFEIFDENGDGFISMDEMFKFLTSVFKVVLTPHVMGVMNSMGVTVESAEDLASVTALECFKSADLNQDGKLSVTEFKGWFYAPRNDPSFLFSPVRKLLQ